MRLEAKTTIDASRQRIWNYVTDPANALSYFANFTRWDVESEQDRGLGARYAIRMQVGSAEVGGLVEVVEYDEPGDIAWNSVTGLDQRGRWRLRERERGKTDVSLRLAYQAPGGLLGTISDRLSAPQVKRNLEETLKRLKAELEDGKSNGAAGASVPGPRQIVQTVGRELQSASVLVEAGVIRPNRPDRILRSLMTLSRWGATPAAGFTAAAITCPDDTAIIDELGQLTFREVHEHTNALANALSDEGIVEGDKVAVMCRNHRGFIEATVALSKLGAHTLFMNTGFAAPQFAEVSKREQVKAIIYDQEFGKVLSEAKKRRKRFIAWVDDESKLDEPTLEDLIAEGDTEEPLPPEDPGRTIILTSGTTGTPKGASRKQPSGLSPAAALFSRIPLRAREKWMIAAPLFHSWGFAHFTLGMPLQATYVLRRKFDPEDTLRAVAEHQCTSMPVVPVMLHRIMELPEATRKKYDVSSLRTVPASGSALPGDLALRFMDEFGDILYNLYGSTEVAWATIATPEDMRAAPGTAGKPPLGTTLKIFDQNGRECPTGVTGRIFVGNEMLFEGYTGGGSKDMIDGLMATGDVGHLDEAGRLFVDGRDDDMIVSGGENVFPQEVEDLIAKRRDVSEVAVIGVPDEQFGQRLKAFVVKKPRAKVTEDDIKGAVKKNLARYKVPREVEFMKELPRNQTGKVVKRELQEKKSPSRRKTTAASSRKKSG